MSMKKLMTAGMIAVALQSISPAQAQQVTTKSATTGDIISYMLLGAVATATVWYLWPAAATAEVATARVGVGAAGMAGRAAAPLVADAAAAGGAAAAPAAAAGAAPAAAAAPAAGAAAAAPLVAAAVVP